MARRVKGIGTEVDLVTVVVAIAVGIGVRRVGAKGCLVGIREAVIVAIEAQGLSSGSLWTGSGVCTHRNACGIERVAAGRHLLPVRDPIAIRVPEERIGAIDKEFLPIGETIAVGVPDKWVGPVEIDLIAVGHPIPIGVGCYWSTRLGYSRLSYGLGRGARDRRWRRFRLGGADRVDALTRDSRRQRAGSHRDRR